MKASQSKRDKRFNCLQPKTLETETITSKTATEVEETTSIMITIMEGKIIIKTRGTKNTTTNSEEAEITDLIQRHIMEVEVKMTLGIIIETGIITETITTKTEVQTKGVEAITMGQIEVKMIIGLIMIDMINTEETRQKLSYLQTTKYFGRMAHVIQLQFTMPSGPFYSCINLSMSKSVTTTSNWCQRCLSSPKSS